MAKKNKVKKIKGLHNLSAGLFGYRGRYWYKNIGDFWILIKRVFFAIKHGYAPQALWETDRWFIGAMREILTNYRNNRIFCGFFDDESDEENKRKTNETLDHMLELLDRVEPIFVFDDENTKDFKAAKDEFFSLFSKYFYYFWE